MYTYMSYLFDINSSKMYYIILFYLEYIGYNVAFA